MRPQWRAIMPDGRGFNTAKGSPPMRHLSSWLSFAFSSCFNTAKGSPPMRPLLNTALHQQVVMFQYRKRVSPHAASYRIFHAFSWEVSIPQKGLPPCGFPSPLLIDIRAIRFQYRKRVSPHAALRCCYHYNIIWWFQYRKRVSPHAAAGNVLFDCRIKPGFNTAKGSPPMRLAHRQSLLITYPGFNTAKGSPPMRHEIWVLSDNDTLVSIPQKGLPPCGYVQIS